MSTTIVTMGGRDAVQVEVPTLVLRVLEGPDAGMTKVFEATPVVVGTSSDADLPLTDPSVSQRHLELDEGPRGVALRDLGSTNGTYLGAVRVEEVLLEADTEIRAGTTRLRVELRADPRVAMVADGPESRTGGMVGRSDAFRTLAAALRAAGPARASVLLLGESGTGKELAARELHARSGREGPFVVFDASTADPAMLRSDLFGHVKGAFTGADAAREGAFRAARGGTLFLDEIGELPLELQAHLLRVLESREVKPVGSDRAAPVDVRVVAATHRDLGRAVREDRFRRDLFHRLSVVVLRVPALRERTGDLPLLVAALQEGMGTTVEFTPAAWEAMEAHDWPGNVRELRNVVERASVLAAGRAVEPADLSLGLDSPEAPGPDTPERSLSAARPVGAGYALEEAAQDAERAAIVAALEASGGKRGPAAEALGISLATLWRRMKKYDL